MKNLITTLFIFSIFSMTAQKSIHEFSFVSIDGQKESFSKFKGKKVLIVNTASQCGFTSQYELLQKVHEDFKNDLVVIGFPANNFGGQEPGSNHDISSFCKKNYGVTFLMSEKVSVRGKDINEVFKWLNAQENNSFKGDIMWNFEKFLIDENGKLIERFRSTTRPNSEKITSLI